MRALLINPPYQTFTSNFGVGHQMPLGLLMVGGALLGAGHEAELLDAEALRLSVSVVAKRVAAARPLAIFTGHAGATPAHPVTMRMLAAIKAALPGVVAVYGGPFPTYHAREILAECLQVDVIVRGEGEATAIALAEALDWSRPGAERDAALINVAGIAFRSSAGEVVETPDRAPIDDLNRYRTGWELINDWDRYQCGGVGRSAIVQFSRGCPHRCTYCGQHGFWVSWRHRDPVAMADEIEWLAREKGVRFITLADENPTTLREVWTEFLREVASRRLPVKFFATIRATDIVRDAERLPLWRDAGILYILMGIDATDPDTIKAIRKGSTTRIDHEACRLLRANGILSVLGFVAGLGDETSATFRDVRAQLALYDGDLLNAMYITPHSWTAFARQMAARRISQPNQAKWDYRHQVLAQSCMNPAQLFWHMKALEAWFHLRPAKLWRALTNPDTVLRAQYRWTLLHTSAVYAAEVIEFLTTRRPRAHATVAERFGWPAEPPTETLLAIQTRPAERIPAAAKQERAL